MLEREQKREKNLESRMKEIARRNMKKNNVKKDKGNARDEAMIETLRQVDADFLAMIKEAEDDESKAAEASPLDHTMPEDK